MMTLLASTLFFFFFLGEGGIFVEQINDIIHGTIIVRACIALTYRLIRSNLLGLISNILMFGCK
jgi:hypothetical protein